MDGTWNDERKRLLIDTSRVIYSSAGFTFVIGGCEHERVVAQAFPVSALSPRSLPPAAPARRGSIRLRPDVLPRTALCWYMSSSLIGVAQSHSFFSSCFVGSGEFEVKLPGLGGSATAPVGDVTAWKDEQLEERAALPASDRDRLQPRPSDGVLLYVDNDEFGRCFVPESQRAPLVKLAHESLFHLGYAIVYAHLRRWYWWPVRYQFPFSSSEPLADSESDTTNFLFSA